MLKRVFKNWKFSALVLGIFIILNITLLCQPVLGKYSGVTNPSSNYYYSSSYNTDITFKGGRATINHHKSDDQTIYAGVYEIVDDEIRIVCFNYTEFNSFFDVKATRGTYTRNSVFSISSGENQYTSGVAVFLQVFYAIIELIFLIRLISQLIQLKKDAQETTEQNYIQTIS